MESKTHRGSCHCGAVKFTATGDFDNAITCNCSMCSRAGTILAFIPAENFQLESGEKDLTSYHFNKKVIDHLFCKHCGIKPFARGKAPDGSETIAVNLRCLDGFDQLTIKTTPYDGKSA